MRLLQALRPSSSTPKFVSIKLSLECRTRPLGPTHAATLSSTQHLFPTASTEKETRSITRDSTEQGEEQRRVGGRQQAFYQQNYTTKKVQCYLKQHIVIARNLSLLSELEDLVNAICTLCLISVFLTCSKLKSHIFCTAVRLIVKVVMPSHHLKLIFQSSINEERSV